MTGSAQIAHSLVADLGHSRLKDFVIESTGLTYYANRDEDLADRIHRRLSKLGLTDCASYLRMLQDGQTGDGEFDALVAELTIGETHFFRHQEQFDALRDTVLPDLIERKKHVRRLRIWSAGCATGPEPYSVAILLKRDLAHLVDGWDINVLGTDINREFLARATEGQYDDWAFRSCPDDLKHSCFSRSGTSWAIKPEYKEYVSFQYHNLVKHTFPSLLHNLAAFDLILCRNVMIYFSADLIRALLTRFEQCLVEGGWFLAGHAESNVELFRSFRTVNAPGATVYQRTTEANDAPVASLQKWEAPREAVSIVFAPEEQSSPPMTVELSDIRLLADQGQCEKALQGVRALLETQNLNSPVHFCHALVLEQMGLHAETERALRRAIYLDRKFVLAHYCLGLCLQRKRDSRGAIHSFQNVLDSLSLVDATHTFPDGDGITSADLRELTEMNLEVLRNL